MLFVGLKFSALHTNFQMKLIAKTLTLALDFHTNWPQAVWFGSETFFTLVLNIEAP